MLRSIFNESLKQHLTKQPTISKTIQSETNKTSETLLEKQGRTHKGHSFMDPYAWTCQCYSTCKNIDQHCADSRWSLEELPVAIDDRDRWRERERQRQRDRESQWNSCCRRDLMTICIYIGNASWFSRQNNEIFRFEIIQSITQYLLRHKRGIK